MQHIRRCCVVLLFLSSFALAADLPGGDRWLAHLNADLMPFWSMPSALGNPVGAFPAIRCDDGSLVDPANPCPPVGSNSYLFSQIGARTLVSQSRQIYGYGVAYHLTGDPKYLNWMKAGVDFLRQNFIDRAGGGMFLVEDLSTGTFGPSRELRDPQQLGYGLLGLAFYYYLTRDQEVLQDLVTLKNYIFENYWNAPMGAMQWHLPPASDSYARNVVADLDQMNTYLVLATPILPEPYQAQWKESMLALSRSMLGVYYSPQENLIFTAANSPQDRSTATADVDFGHTAKALWMMRWAGLMAGDRGLVNFAEAQGKRHIERSYLQEDQSWAQGYTGGQVNRNKNWWIYAELDQFSGTLALVDPAAGLHLPQTNEYWFRYFVDPQYGEVWNGLDYLTNAPQRDYPKAWQWKSAYHSLEHALVGYITSQQILRQPFTLHYAFKNQVDQATIRPYFFSGRIESVTGKTGSAGEPLQEVRFAAADAPAGPQALTAVSAASYLPGPLSPSSLSSAFGTGLANMAIAADSNPYPLELGGTTVSVLDSAGSTRRAGLLYVSPNMLNFMIPADTASGAATISVRAGNGNTVTGTVEIATAAPAIFQLEANTSLAAANVVRVRADNSQAIEAVFQLDGAKNVLALPLDLGAAADRVYLALYGTGVRNAKTVTATVGGFSVPVLYAGAHGTFPGLDQVNIGPLPRLLAGSRSANIVLVADGQTAAPVQIAIE